MEATSSLTSDLEVREVVASSAFDIGEEAFNLKALSSLASVVET